jgi:tetratricopeptide (TPR) repeat protein
MFRVTLTLLTVLVIFSPAFCQSLKGKSWIPKADTLYEHEEYSKAAELYTRIIDANRRREGSYRDRSVYNFIYKRAVCYYSIDEYEKALADVAIFEPEFPRSAQPKILKAFIYRELDDRDKQLENLNAAMALQAPKADFLKWRGLLEIQSKDYSKAYQDLKRAKSMDDDSEVEAYLGMYYYGIGDRDSAFLSFNKAIELNPAYLSTYLYAGSVAMEVGEYPKALEYLDLGLRMEPKNPDLLFYRGIALVESNQIDEGCRCLNRAFYSGADDAGDYLQQYCFGSN